MLTIRCGVQTFKTDSHAFRLPRELGLQLTQFARAQGTDVFTVLLSAFQVYLMRHSGQRDLLVAVPMCGRDSSMPEIANVVGNFENYVPIRARMEGDPTTRNFIQQQQEIVAGARAYRHFPFSALCERLLGDTYKPLAASKDHATHRGRAPVCQVAFTFESGDWSEQDYYPFLMIGEKGTSGTVAGVRSLPLSAPKPATAFDLSLLVAASNDVMTGAIQFNTALYSKDTAARMAEHLRVLLQGMVQNPDLKLTQLPILPAPERHLVVEKWNDTAGPARTDACVHQLVEEQVARTPDAPAIVIGDEVVSYAELNTRANRLAHYLRFLGIKRESLVPVFLHRSVDLVVCWYAALKSGGSVMPLDPKYPPERLSMMLGDAEASVILTQASLADRVPGDFGGQVIRVDVDGGSFATASGDNPTCINSPSDVAYAIYTSGSTGRPKGVMLEHHSLVNYMSWHVPYYEMVAGDRVLHNAGLAFDASMAETWPSLSCGACLYPCVDDEVRMVPSNLLEWMADQKIKVAFLTTQLAEAVLEEETWPAHLELRVLYTGGDKLHRGPRVGVPYKLVNIYGPTENTVNTTMCEVPQGLLTPPTIGSPVMNTQVYVLDERLEPVPVGVYGELYLAGVQLFRGYFRAPELTKEKLVANPFSSEEGALMYKTGDLVRWTADGNIEFFGRIDTQVKIRGFRIELGGIEATLLALAEVRLVCVIAREDQPGNKRLVAYVVFHKGCSLEVSAMKAAVSSKLAEFMVPSAFVILDELPLTPNGKVDRRLLPAPTESDGSGLNYIAPRNAVEAAVAELFSTELKADKVGATSSFFDLGGHSLSAARVIRRVRERFDVVLPIVRLFDSPTVAALSQRITELLHRKEQAASLSLASSLSAAAGQSAGAGAGGGTREDAGAADTSLSHTGVRVCACVFGLCVAYPALTCAALVASCYLSRVVCWPIPLNRCKAGLLASLRAAAPTSPRRSVSPTSPRGCTRHGRSRRRRARRRRYRWLRASPPLATMVCRRPRRGCRTHRPFCAAGAGSWMRRLPCCLAVSPPAATPSHRPATTCCLRRWASQCHDGRCWPQPIPRNPSPRRCPTRSTRCGSCTKWTRTAWTTSCTSLPSCRTMASTSTLFGARSRQLWTATQPSAPRALLCAPPPAAAVASG